MRAFYESHKQLIDRGLFFGLIILVVYSIFTWLFTYVAPFLSGLVIALILEPLLKLLVRKARFGRGGAAAICLVLFLAAIGILSTLIVSNVYKQTVAFLDAAPQIIDELSRKLDDVNEWLSAMTDNMSDSLYFEFPDIKDTLMNGLTKIFGDGVKDRSLRMVSSAPNFLIGVMLSLVSAFFFMKDRPLIFKVLSDHTPEWVANNFRLMRRGLAHAVGGYFRAQFILMSITGILSIGGLLILRNPYALMLGLIMAVLDFMPALGTGTLLLPWAIVSLLTGQYGLAVGLLVLYGVITITRQSLEPKILGEQIGVHPLVTLMSVYVGFRIFGLFGILVGPSLVIIFKAVYTDRQSL